MGGGMMPGMGGGGSFLGTAAASAAGFIGGSMLLNGIRGMMGGHQAFAGDHAQMGRGGSPWTAAAPERSAAMPAIAISDAPLHKLTWIRTKTRIRTTATTMMTATSVISTATISTSPELHTA